MSLDSKYLNKVSQKWNVSLDWILIPQLVRLPVQFWPLIRKNSSVEECAMREANFTSSSLCNFNFCCYISETYGNILRQEAAVYISNCVTYALKGMQLEKDYSKPVISSGFLQRLQVPFWMACGSAGFEFYIKPWTLQSIKKIMRWNI